MSLSDYDHVASGTLTPINDHVIVTNIEDENERVVNGIIVPAEAGEGRGVRPRWAQVHAVGPDHVDVEPGQWVLIEHGRWTRGVKIDGQVYRKVDVDGLLGVSDEKPEF